MAAAQNTELAFSRHARVRQKQRDITDRSVEAAMEDGAKIEYENSTLYTDQNVKVVVSKDGQKIVTVGKNTRNTKFMLLERTEEKKASLIHRVNTRNDNHAMCELADLYLNGELGERDVQKAHDLFERAARAGNSHAMCKLSGMYSEGDLGTPNQGLADLWLRKAADRNNVYALAVVGQELLHKYLEKYPVDSKLFRPSAPRKEIFNYLNRAAGKGSTRAMWQLGNIYENGLLGETDLPKAIELYVKAAKLGSPTSLSTLHNLAMEAKFSAEELEEILDDLLPVLTVISRGMAFQLGVEQIHGHLGRNPVRGLKMVEKIAFKQYDEAIRQMAVCYREGIACECNPKLAQYWLTKLKELYSVSAEKGNVRSLWKLGKLYLKGCVGDIDLGKAESCLEKAARRSSDPKMMHKLGLLYLEGRLGDRPTSIGNRFIGQSLKIWKRQADQGNKDACFELGLVYFSIDSHKNAVYWFSRSPDDVASQLCLCEMLLDGSSPEKDTSVGLRILEDIILEHGVPPWEASKNVNFVVDEETSPWLQDIADKVPKPASKSDQNRYEFQKWVISTLADAHETGKLGEVDHVLASKYYHQLFVDFESIPAGNKLLRLCNRRHLPDEYYDLVKNYAQQIPTRLETGIDTSVFVSYVRLLGETYKNGVAVPFDVKEATKWLHLALYFERSDGKRAGEQDWANLPDSDQKEQIVSELAQLTQKIKIVSPLTYRVMSRILGDMFYDNKMVKRNIDEAIRWYTESSAKNNALASLALAKIHQKDKPDRDASVRWYMVSARLGNKEALGTLRDIPVGEQPEALSQFLSTYQHRSSVEEALWKNAKPLWNLEIYPKTDQEMYQLGMGFLESGNEQDMLKAAHWFRNAMNKGNPDAAVELLSMYKSGRLGINLVAAADNIRVDVLDTCHDALKERLALHDKLNVFQYDQHDILPLLKNVSRALEIGNFPSSAELIQSIEALVSETREVNKRTLQDLLSKIEFVERELFSAVDTTLSKDFDTNLVEDNPPQRS